MYNFLFYEPRYDLSSYKSINLVKYDVLIVRNWEKHSDAFFLMDMNGSLTNIFYYELHWAWIHWPWYHWPMFWLMNEHQVCHKHLLGNAKRRSFMQCYLSNTLGEGIPRDRICIIWYPVSNYLRHYIPSNVMFTTVIQSKSKIYYKTEFHANLMNHKNRWLLLVTTCHSSLDSNTVDSTELW